MELVPEPTNPVDRYAVKVMAPQLYNIPEGLWTEITAHNQRVRDVAGQMIGHVPRDLCTVISRGIQSGDFLHAIAVYIGGFTHTDGPALNCIYHIELNENIPVQQYAHAIRPYVNDMDIFL